MTSRELKRYIFENDKIVDILEHLNMVHINTSNSKYISCGFIDGDNTSSTIIYKDEYLTTIAYTRNIKQDESKSTDIINLVAFILKMEYRTAKGYLASYLGLSDEGKGIKSKDPISFFRKTIRKTKKDTFKEQVYYDLDILEGYSNIPHIDLIKKDGLISQAVLDKYSVLFDYRSDRIVFPHFLWCDSSKVCGLVGRTVRPAYKELNIKKYMSLLPTEYIKTQNLYALNLNMEAIKEKDEIILVEAEKSVMKLDIFKLNSNAVSVGCHSISPYQKKIILGLKVNNIVIAFDNDVSEEDIKKECDMFYDYMNVFYIKDKWGLLTDKDSPMDRGLKKYRFLYNHKIQYKREVNYEKKDK